MTVARMIMMKKYDDISVEGPGSPISLRKWYENENKDVLKDTVVLIDSDGVGFEPDGLPCMEVTPQGCKECTEHYIDNHFNSKQIPLYILKPFYYMMIGNFDVYKKDVDVPALEKYFGEDEKGKKEYQELLNKIKYAPRSAESSQVLGLIIMLCSGFQMANKSGVPARFYIEHPESHLHPKRESRLMYMINKIREDYDHTFKKNQDELSE
jgi:hypothetical protein